MKNEEHTEMKNYQLIESYFRRHELHMKNASACSSHAKLYINFEARSILKHATCVATFQSMEI